jgi:hypothetical protein
VGNLTSGRDQGSGFPSPPEIIAPAMLSSISRAQGYWPAPALLFRSRRLRTYPNRVSRWKTCDNWPGTPIRARRAEPTQAVQANA